MNVLTLRSTVFGPHSKEFVHPVEPDKTFSSGHVLMAVKSTKCRMIAPTSTSWKQEIFSDLVEIIHYHMSFS
jgi:hypothetical protein